MDTANILLVDDDKSTRVVLTALLEDSAYTVRACGTAEEALGHLMSQDPVDVVVSDLRLPDGSGLQVLWALKKINPNAAFILITGYASLETAIEAVNEGAFAYHVKPLDMDALTESIRNALRHKDLAVECRTLLERIHDYNVESGIDCGNLLEKVREYNVELADKNLELERASREKSQILVTVSHELMTPLSSIMGHTEVMLFQPDKVGPLTSRQRKYLEAAHQDSLRLKSLIDDLLDCWTRPESRQAASTSTLPKWTWAR